VARWRRRADRRKIIVGHLRWLRPARRRRVLRKDPSKVDRSAAYALRWVAKNVVAAKLASKVEVQVAYAIGKAEPWACSSRRSAPRTADPAKIAAAISETFDLRPAAIIRDLDLKRPIYAQTAAYGHFGRELPDFTWERTDKAEQLAKLANG